ncbi:MAG: dUTP diphosphatase, partial [Pseudomonadales bacterium]|nr:dUTP diphosphatase [Pseudomonadales bacterium]
MKQQILTMLEMQEKMNQRVHPDWRNQGFEWYRAIWVECAELMDHYGWKWWKKQTPDMDQVHLELIDIWHFGLSYLLSSGRVSLDELAAQVENELSEPADADDFRAALECFTEWTLTHRAFKPAWFGHLLQASGLSFDDLFTGYIGKNVLNFFRQDHG